MVLTGEARPARVDAIGGDEALTVGGEVRRGEAEVASAGVAVDDGAFDPVVAAELIGRLGNIACDDLVADPGGGEPAPASDLVDRHGGEAVDLAEAAQRVDGACVVMAEADVVADDDAPAVEALDEVAGDELLRGLCGEVEVVGLDEEASMPVSAMSCDFCRTLVIICVGVCGWWIVRGCGSKVIATERSPFAFASAATARSTVWWPRWTPSKLPRVMTVPMPSLGTSSSP